MALKLQDVFLATLLPELLSWGVREGCLSPEVAAQALRREREKGASVAEGTVQESVDAVTLKELVKRRGPLWVAEKIHLQTLTVTGRPVVEDGGTLKIEADGPMYPTWTASQPTCGTCRLFQSRFPQDPTYREGVCRRYPPSPSHGCTSVTSDDWCGEYQAR